MSFGTLQAHTLHPRRPLVYTYETVATYSRIEREMVVVDLNSLPVLSKDDC